MRPEDLITYCGFYGATCGQWCQNKTLRQLSGALLQLVDAMNFSRWRPDDSRVFEYAEFRKGLGYFSREDTQVVCRKCCQAGEGNDECKVRICCRQRGYLLCFDCPEFDHCEHYKDNAERRSEAQYYRAHGKDAWLRRWMDRAERGYEVHARACYNISVERDVQ